MDRLEPEERLRRLQNVATTLDWLLERHDDNARDQAGLKVAMSIAHEEITRLQGEIDE